jgi:polyisoprenoid-binding protein YceI
MTIQSHDGLDAALERIAASIDGGLPDSAAIIAGAARSRWPHEAEPARLHVIALFQLGRIDDALSALHDAQTIDPRSISSDNAPAGFLEMLSGKDWLDAADFPQMTFRSKSIEVTGANTFRIRGELTLHGVTKPVTLDASYNGGYAGHPMDPHARIGFSARGTFKRSDFGVSIGIPAPGSNMGVGDEVEVVLESEFTGPPLAQGR